MEGQYLFPAVAIVGSSVTAPTTFIAATGLSMLFLQYSTTIREGIENDVKEMPQDKRDLLLLAGLLIGGGLVCWNISQFPQLGPLYGLTAMSLSTATGIAMGYHLRESRLFQ
jgi:hypothetical protein